MKTRRVLAFLLVAILVLSIAPQTQAADKSVSLEEAFNSWNLSPSKSYKGASGCAAFVRYVFMQMYGHKETKRNNQYFEIPGNSGVADLKKAVFDSGRVVPGDAIRITKTGLFGLETKTTHIFIVLELTDDGCVSYDAGFLHGENSENYAAKYSKTYNKVLSDIGIAAEDQYVIKVSHAYENSTVREDDLDGNANSVDSYDANSHSDLLERYAAYYQTNLDSSWQTYGFDVTHDGAPEMIAIQSSNPKNDDSAEVRVFTSVDGNIIQILGLQGSYSHAGGYLEFGIYQENGEDYIFSTADEMYQGMGTLQFNICWLHNDGKVVQYLHDELTWDGNDPVTEEAYNEYIARKDHIASVCLILLDTQCGRIDAEAMEHLLFEAKTESNSDTTLSSTSDWAKAYVQLLQSPKIITANIKKQMPDGRIDGRYDYDGWFDTAYIDSLTLFDIDGNQVPEIIITLESGPHFVFTWQNDTVVDIGAFYLGNAQGFWTNDTRELYFEAKHMSYSVEVYRLSISNHALKTRCIMEKWEEPGAESSYYNGSDSISKNECDQIHKQTCVKSVETHDVAGSITEITASDLLVWFNVEL